MSETLNECSSESGYAIGAVEINQTIKADIDLPADRFWVQDARGFDAQVRLDQNGQIYLC